MKEKALLTLSLLALSVSLVSCANKTEPLYTIDFYTDYADIHNGELGGDYTFSDNLDKSKAKHVGKGYVVQSVSKEDRKAHLTSFAKGDDGNPIAYEKSAQSAEGYRFVFDGWQGFYDDGKPVNLNEIEGDCAVFAHFKAELDTCNVTISNADSSVIFSSLLDYGTRLGEALTKEFGSEDKAKEKLSNIDYPLPSRYYETYAFSKTYKDGDGNALAIDDIFAKEIKDDLKLTAVFDGAVMKSYVVSFYSDDTKASKLDETEEVTYGCAVKKTLLDLPDKDGHHYVFAGWGDETDVYGDDAPAEIQGRKVDPTHILWDCTLTPLFKETPIECRLTFLNADNSENSSTPVDYGTQWSQVKIPEKVVGLADGDAYSGFWKRADKSWMKDDDEITSDIVLSPVCCLSEVKDKEGASGDTMSFEYDFDRRGYNLTKFTPSSSRTSKILSGNDLAIDALPDNFELVGIKKLSDGEWGYSASASSSIIEEAAFPSSVKYIDSNAFRGNLSLAKLSLPGASKIYSYGLSQLYSLAEFTVPSTIAFLGNSIFYGDEALSKIEIDMSEVDFKNVDAQENWNSNGKSLIDCSYKEA
jgi:hypothetical protein